MKKRITQAVATRAKPTAKPYQIHDTLIPGFVLRIQPSGRKLWKLIVNRKTITLGEFPQMSFSMAQTKARQILSSPIEPQQRQVLTLRQYVDEYYHDYSQAHHARPGGAERVIERIGIWDRKLDEISPADIDKDCTARLTAGIAKATVNRDVAVLKAALSKALEWDLITVNPLARIKPLKLDESHVTRYLSSDEEERLYDALLHSEPRIQTIVTVALNTGTRKKELLSLTWGDVDLKNRILTVHGYRAKSKQTRHVPLNESGIKALRKWRGDVIPLANVPVFGTTELRTRWRQLLQAANVKAFRFHDCRHHFASKLVMAGVPLNTVRELLGHSDIKMTMRYAHLAPSTMSDAVKLIG